MDHIWYICVSVELCIPYVKSCPVIFHRNVLNLEDADLELVICLANPWVGEADVPKPRDVRWGWVWHFPVEVRVEPPNLPDPPPHPGTLHHGDRVKGVRAGAQQGVVVALLTDEEHLPSFICVHILIILLISNPQTADLSQWKGSVHLLWNSKLILYIA